MTEPSFSLVLPVHNQADHIGQVVEGYTDVLGRLGVTHELVLVTNACTDDSPRVCADLAASHENVKTLDLADGGWGRAVRAGLGIAGGDVLGYTNTARTTPQILALCVSYSRLYPEVVVKANRRIRDNWRRRLGSLIYNLECRSLFDLPIWDVNGTPKLFPSSFEKLRDLRATGDLIDAEFAAVCASEGYPIVEVPLLATTRHGGRSTTNYGSALRMYRGAIALRRQTPRP